MTLLDDIQQYFGTKNLYDVLGASQEFDKDQIKKAYRKASLKIHPDRVGEDQKEEATKKFQVLAQVHFVLNDEERRKLYDDHGIISNEDSLDSDADWANYWRLLFPKVTEKDIKNFMTKYNGSQEEEDDLIDLYNRYKGDMDKISESHISFDENRTREHIDRLIDEGKLKKLKKFADEPEVKKERRRKRAEREAKQAEKAKKAKEDEEPDFGSLVAAIQQKSKNNFDSMIQNLEAKYASKASKKASGTKRKRGPD